MSICTYDGQGVFHPCGEMNLAQNHFIRKHIKAGEIPRLNGEVVRFCPFCGESIKGGYDLSSAIVRIVERLHQTVANPGSLPESEEIKIDQAVYRIRGIIREWTS